MEITLRHLDKVLTKISSKCQEQLKIWPSKLSYLVVEAALVLQHHQISCSDQNVVWSCKVCTSQPVFSMGQHEATLQTQRGNIFTRSKDWATLNVIGRSQESLLVDINSVQIFFENSTRDIMVILLEASVHSRDLHHQASTAIIILQYLVFSINVELQDWNEIPVICHCSIGVLVMLVVECGRMLSDQSRDLYLEVSFQINKNFGVGNAS